MKSLLILVLEDDILGGVLSWPIWELGARVAFYRNDGDVKRFILAHKPDVVLLDEPCPPVLETSTLEWLKNEQRTIRLVWDASDVAWHPYLLQRRDFFHAVIAADGAVDWPARDCDASLPTPVDPRWYPDEQLPRVHRLGFSGSVGNTGPRYRITECLKMADLLKVRYRGPQLMPYADNANFYRQCHAVLNVAHTTSGRLQCKARAIEAALAGCLLFETAGSPTRNWLEPGIDYVEYETAEQVREFCHRSDFEETCRQMGEMARLRMRALDLPRRFWSFIMGEQL